MDQKKRHALPDGFQPITATSPPAASIGEPSIAEMIVLTSYVTGFPFTRRVKVSTPVGRPITRFTPWSPAVAAEPYCTTEAAFIVA
jgi:hypothetical protein